MSLPWRTAEWNLVFRVLPRAHRGLACAWWALVTARSLAPAALIIATGGLIGAVSAGHRPGWSLAVVLVASILILVLSPIHDAVSANLGAQVGADLHERLLRAAIEPAGVAHLEEPDLADDFALARDFEYAGGKLRSDAAVARLRRRLGVLKPDHAAGEPVIHERRHAAGIKLETRQGGIIAHPRNHEQ